MLIALGLTLLSFVLTIPIFAPVAFWPLAWVALVPWLVALVIIERTRTALAISYLLGAAFYLYHLRWLSYPTPPGYAAASLCYLALYFPASAYAIRHLHRRRGLSMMLIFPLVWIGQEFIRSHGPLAFPWFHLGHTQIRLLTMIQIADIGGAYLVSLVVALVNGWVADRVLLWIVHRKDPSIPTPRHIPVGGITIVVVLLATLLYGVWRLNTRQVTPGPRIAVLQGDFLLNPRGAPAGQNEKQRETYLRLFDRACGEKPKPDLAVFPESAWIMHLNRELRVPPTGADVPRGLKRYAERSHSELIRLAEAYETPFVINAPSREYNPPGSGYDMDGFNSAFVYRPGEPEPQRYDKVHLVPFGEYIPFHRSRNWRWVYHFLNDGPWNPWGQVHPDKRRWHWPSFPLKDWKPFGEGGYDYSQTPGETFDTFHLTSDAMDGEQVRFGITICYEDVMPYVFREFTLDEKGNKRVGFMLNISNDGWFGHGNQQAQHLVASAFRAIENRVPVARAANTGISGFVESDGSWHDLVTGGRGLQAGGEGHRTARLQLDPRITVYSRYGDIIAVLCTIWAVGAVFDALIYSVWERIRSRRQRKQEA